MSQLSPSEKRGLLMIGVVLLSAFIIQWIQPYYVHENLYDYSIQDSVFKSLSADTLKEEKIKNAGVTVHTPKTISSKSKKLKAPLEQININTASQKQLEKLPRIGPATAKNIIEYRKANGPFKTFKSVMKVKRIGPKTLEKIKPFIVLTDSL